MDAPVGFEEFVHEQSRALLRTAWLLTGDWNAAEDLVQGALVVAWTHWGALSRPDAPLAYVRRVLVHSYLRSRRRRWNGEQPTAELPEHLASDEYGGSDRHTDLARALATLPARQRAAVALRYFADLTEVDTAQVMGCSVGAVKSHTAKALARLRRSPLLADEYTEGVTE